jgi:probable HAF family extracellular repeat protein
MRRASAGAVAAPPFSIANSINQYGRIVGASSTASGNVHAVLWSEHRRIVDLGTAGGLNSIANSINDHGEIVGVSNTASGARHAVLWTR